MNLETFYFQGYSFSQLHVTQIVALQTWQLTLRSLKVWCGEKKPKPHQFLLEASIPEFYTWVLKLPISHQGLMKMNWFNCWRSNNQIIMRGTPSYSCNSVHVPACFVIVLVFLVWISVYLSVYVQNIRHSRAVKKTYHGELYIITEAWHSFLHSANAGFSVLYIGNITCNETNFIMTRGFVGWFVLGGGVLLFFFVVWGGVSGFSFSKKNIGSDILTATTNCHIGRSYLETKASILNSYTNMVSKLLRISEVS